MEVGSYSGEGDKEGDGEILELVGRSDPRELEKLWGVEAPAERITSREAKA